MKKQNTKLSISIKSIEKELNKIDKDEVIEVNLKHLLFIHLAVEKIRYFLHNEDHYSDLVDIKQYIGNKNKGMFSVIDDIYTKKLWEMIPDEIQNRLEDS